MMVSAALTATAVGFGATAAPQAMALSHDEGTTSRSGNGAEQPCGNARTAGGMSPRMPLVQGSLGAGGEHLVR
jgi:hypothetical protein